MKNNEHDPHSALSRNVLFLLKPLVRILLRAGIGFAHFAEWVKYAYVEVAEQEFTLAHRSQSTSRIATLTGLHRKEVARIREALAQSQPIFVARAANRAERVINVWLSDANYCDGSGNAKILPLNGAEVSFEKLAQKASGDIHNTTILDELLRIKAVEVIDGKYLRLNTQGYFPAIASDEQLAIFGQCAYDLLSTLDNNINPNAPSRRFQRSVAYKHLSAEALAEFQEYSRQEGELLLLKMNAWLASHELTEEQQLDADIQYRAGLGIYYFDEACSDQVNADTEITKRSKSNENDAN